MNSQFHPSVRQLSTPVKGKRYEVDCRRWSETMQQLRQPVRRRFESRAEGEEWCSDLLLALRTGTPVEHIRLPVQGLFEAYLDEMETLPSERTGKKRSPRTVDGYRYDLSLFITLPRRTQRPTAEPLVGWGNRHGVDHVEQCSDELLQRYSKWLRGNYTPLVARKALVTLKAVFDWACEEGFIDRVPAIKIPGAGNSHKRRALTDDERLALLTKGDEKYRDTWRFILATGLRLREYTSLYVDDFTTALVGGEPCWQVRVQGKGGKERFIALSGLDELVQRMIDAALSRSNCPGRISPVCYSRLSRVWSEEERSRMGLPDDVTIHVLRHDFGTGLRNEGVDIQSISKLMGHSSVRITADLYIHDSPQIQAAAVGKRARSLEVASHKSDTLAQAQES